MLSSDECFVGEVGEKVQVDSDFSPRLNAFAAYARRGDGKIGIMSSLWELGNDIRGAIEPPASRSCHDIGHAIDLNILYNGRHYDSKKLRNGDS